MNQISNEALEFLSEAKEQMAKNPEWSTYRDTESNFIALRTGLFDDCIMIYELGNEVGNFTEQLPRQRKVLIDYDQREEYKKQSEQMDKLKDINVSQLVQTLEDGLVNSGWLDDEMSVYEFIKDYLTRY